MSKQVLLLFLSMVAFNNFVAQELPEIIPPSPRAESFHIYGDIPVDYSTGVPDISIPLYTIKSGDITVPITLRYHINSIKPGRDVSNVAFGWILDVGGRISRTVNMWPDEYVKRPTNSKFTNDLNPINQDDFMYLNRASMQYGADFDTKYDSFSYSALGEQSKFIINNKEGENNITIHELIKSPKNIALTTIINSYFNNAIPSLNTFTITNGKGQSLYFGENGNYEIVSGDMEWGRSPSSWLLTKILSVNKNDSINFTYNSVPAETVQTNSWADNYSTAKDHYEDILGGGGNQYFSTLQADCNIQFSNSSSLDYEVKTIKRILFKEGEVLFNLSSDNKRIDSIEIRDKNNNVIKSIVFKKSFFIDANFPNQTAYEKLEGIEINDSNNNKVKNYSFEYYNNGMPREDETDYWGYYNNSSNNNFKRKVLNEGGTISMYTCESGYGNKNASLLHAKSYVLKKIIHPTQGSTEFDYELHQFTGVTDFNPIVFGTINGGGLRIQSIVNKSENGVDINRKTYSYIPRFFNSQAAKSPLNPYNYTSTFYDFHIMSGGGIECPVRNRNRTFSHSFNSGLLDTDINYENVTEYHGSNSTNNNIGKIVYTYEYGIENEYFNKFVVDPLYQFDFTNDPLNQEGLGSNKLVHRYGITGGKLKSTEYFRNNNIYTSIKKIINTYSYIKIINTYKNLNVVNISTYRQGDYLSDFLTRKNNISCLTDARVLPVLGSYDSFIYQSSANLIKQEVKEIQEDGSELTTTKEYDYNENNLVTKQTVYDSNGSSQITKTLYPEDIKTISTLKDDSSIPGGSLTTTAFNAIVDMKDDLINQTAIPIQTETYKDIDDDGIAESNELLSLNRTSFKEWYTDIILPQEIQTLKGAYNSSTNPLQSRIIFEDYYNNGNVKEVYKTDGTHIVYLWGYQQMHPIAKIENATYSQVSTAIVNLSNLSYNSISKIQAISNNDSTTDIDTFDITGNRIYVGEEGDLREVFDLLRLVLTDAQITNFTYDPLIGVTSTTDPRGETIYYEYDNFNRLKQVKDKDGNILSENQYNYKN